jgi:hypothetical protein
MIGDGEEEEEEEEEEMRGIQSEAVRYAGGSAASNLKSCALRCAPGMANVMPGSRSHLF